MDVLKLGASIKTAEPQVQIDPALPPGKYRVTLVVEGSSGTSEPAQITLVVLESPVIPPSPAPPQLVPPVVPPMDPRRILTPAPILREVIVPPSEPTVNPRAIVTPQVRPAPKPGVAGPVTDVSSAKTGAGVPDAVNAKITGVAAQLPTDENAGAAQTRANPLPAAKPKPKVMTKLKPKPK